ncbi:MAG TPA: ferrochelatase [Acidimicrobiales bacterium]|nr:ferrochelatase [Acidimicrobiales bacterium]
MTTGLVVMAYGTPASPDDVEAYYTHIRRGRPPTPEQLRDLVDRYAAIGGVSPLARRTRDQAAAIAAALAAEEPGAWRVELGNKHAPPFLEDAVAAVVAGDPRPDRVVGLVLAPHYSRASVGEYHERAGAAAAERGVPYVRVDSWHDLPAWVDAQARRVREALAGLPAASRVLFTAHSLPERVLAGDPYVDQLRDSAAAIAARAGLAADRWALAWQSAGRTPEPWRGPDVLDVLRDLGATPGVEGVLVCPQGFVSDHLEVLHDLDIEARRVAEEVGLAFARTASINDDPEVMPALARLVRAAAAG